MTIRMFDLCGAEPARRFSPFCWRTRLALAHKGLDVETVPWKFTDREAIESLGAQKVPTILDGDRMVTDSWAIAEYLEEAYPDSPTLFPNGKGEVSFIRWWSEAVLTVGVAGLVMKDIYDHLDPVDQPYFRESREKRFGRTLEEVQAGRDKGVKAFRQALTPMRLTLQHQAWIAGDTPGFADYMCAGPFLWARAISPFRLLDADDSLNDWLNRILDAHGGVARAAPGYD